MWTQRYDKLVPYIVTSDWGERKREIIAVFLEKLIISRVGLLVCSVEQPRKKSMRDRK